MSAKGLLLGALTLGAGAGFVAPVAKMAYSHDKDQAASNARIHAQMKVNAGDVYDLPVEQSKVGLFLSTDDKPQP